MASIFWAAIGSLVWFAVAPVLVAAIVPAWITGWRFSEPWFGLAATRWAGGALIVTGTAGLVDSFVRFVLVGRGTPAPYYHPERLVISGLYRYLRNPMYVAILAAVAGQALLFADRTLLLYAAGLWMMFHIFVVWYEEPLLRSRFGAQYKQYCRAVRRWSPLRGNAARSL